MDNASIHKVGVVESEVVSRGHQVQFLPPYSPFLNPIEESFSKWKGYVRSLSVENERELLRFIEEGFQIITESDCQGYYRNMLRYLNRSRNSEEI